MKLSAERERREEREEELLAAFSVLCLLVCTLLTGMTISCGT